MVVSQPLQNRAWSVALVGRTGERAAVRRWIGEACTGDLRIVAITGPNGIGKSRLLDWSADEMRRRHGVAYVGRCSPGLQHPLGPLVGALDPLGASRPGGKMLSGAGALDTPASFEVTEMAYVRSLTAIVVRESALRPVLLAIEDVHWADPTTLAALEQLAYLLAGNAGDRRILVALTHRALEHDEPASGALARLAREPAYRALPLGPLDESEVQELIRRLTLSAPPRRLVRRVHEMSAGNPLVAIALTDDTDSPYAPQRPATADEVLAARLSRLSPAATGAALALAVAGEPLPEHDVAAIGRATTEATLDALDELERARLVRCTGDVWALAYPNLAEALLSSSTTRERRTLHARVGERLQAGAPSGIDLVRLVHHLEQAGPGHAAELASLAPRAADEAFALGAWGRAAHLYEIALGAADPDDPGRVAALEEGAGVSCFRDFDAEGCLDHLARAAELADAAGDHEMAARARTWHLRRRFTSGPDSIDQPVDITAVTRVVDSDEVPAGPRARAHGLLAEVAFQANDMPAAHRHAEAARRLAGVAGDESVGFWVAISEGLAHLGVLDVEAAADAFGEADDRADRADPTFVGSAGACRGAFTSLLRGELAAADRLGAKAASQAGEAGNWAEHALAESVRAIVAGAQGRFDDQEDRGELARISCGRSANTFTPLLLHPAMAWGRALRGDIGGADAALEELDAAGGRSARYRLAAELIAGDGDQVRKELGEHDWRPFPQALTTYDAGAHAAQLELAIHGGDRDRVAAGRALFEDLHGRGVAFVVEWPSLVPRLLAEAAACLGEVDTALAWATEADHLATAAGARVEQARLAVLRAGLLLARGGDEPVRVAVDLISTATATFDELGMLRFAQWAQRLFDLPPPVDAAVRRLRPRAILFTDIVDSTAWNARLGDDHWLVLLAEHNRLTRQEVRRQRGVVVKTTGDGICAWFPLAADAVDCAAALQQALAEFRVAHPETPIDLRCGVALGDVYDLDGDLAGLAVTEAARICAVAASGQVVTSAAVAEGDERASRSYSRLGPHDLKGLPEAVTLFALDSPCDTRATTESASVTTW